MKPEDEFRRTFSDICVLFELALAVGQSLDLRANCERFLSTLMARKGFSYGSIWLRQSALPWARQSAAAGTASDDVVLVYGLPRAHVRDSQLPSTAECWTRAARGHYSLVAGDPDFASCVAEHGVTDGAYAFFPLGTLGFLKLHVDGRTSPLSAIELEQLETVVRKLVVSLQGCIDHESLIMEVAERTRAEEEREAMREQLGEAQRLEAIGRLAGGVAHDFNNLLTPIMGCAEILERAVGKTGPLAECVSAIQTAGRRAAELTSQLLSFSRRERLRLADIDIDGLVAEVSRLLIRTVDPRIHVSCVLGVGSTGRIIGDPARMQSALLNLAVNACDAMPEGGELTFETEMLTPPTAEQPGRIRVRVRDTGTGMDETVRRRLFEPFFTTKELGRGTGLGLAAVYGAVQSHGGRIDVDSAPGVGSTFTVELPLSPIGPPEEPAAAAFGPTTGQSVLVVDDQREVRNVLCSMLRTLGHAAHAADSGAAALDHLEKSAELPSLVLLDIRMPGMSGAEVLLRMRTRFPKLPVVMVSGFGAENELVRLRTLGVQGTLQKPFTLAELSDAVARALG